MPELITTTVGPPSVCWRDPMALNLHTCCLSSRRCAGDADSPAASAQGIAERAQSRPATPNCNTLPGSQLKQKALPAPGPCPCAHKCTSLTQQPRCAYGQAQAPLSVCRTDGRDG